MFIYSLEKRNLDGFGLSESSARFSPLFISVAALILIGASLAAAMERPTRVQLQSYARDGSLSSRIRNAQALGNHIVAPELVQNYRRQIERIRLGGAAGTDAEIDRVIGRAPTPTNVLSSKGAIKTFALLISFPDYPAAQTPESIAARLFGDGDSGWPFESLRNYYLRSSYGALDISGDVLGWYTPPFTRSGMPQTAEARENLIKDALLYYHNQGHDFSQYDNNGDGTIDYFLVIWTGPDNGWAGFWWGYQASLSDSGSGTFALDGKTFSRTRYSWIREVENGASSFAPGAAIHETGNALGLPDSYSYNVPAGLQSPAGGLDVMDAGRGDHNPLSKMLLGWISPQVAGPGTGTYVLRASGSAPDALLIVPDPLPAGALNEFYLVQNRYRVENDFGLPGDGLLIWHVDSQLAGDGHFVNTNSTSVHPFLSLVRGDDQGPVLRGMSATTGEYLTPGKSVALRFDAAASLDGNGPAIRANGPAAPSQSLTVETGKQGASLGPADSRQTGGGATVVTATAKDLAAAVTGVTYYVDSAAGLDTNSGLSTSAAWKTVAKVNSSHFLPGDSVLFKRGGIWREQLTVSSSGSAGSPLTFGAYGTGARPVINGSAVLTTWALVSGTVYAKSVVTPEPRVVVYNGVRVAKGTGVNLAANQYFYDAGSATLYVNVGENPALHPLEAAAREYVIWISHHDYVSFSNIDTRNTNNAGYYIQDSDHLDLDACLITQVAYRGMLVTNVIGSGETSQYLSFRNMEVSHAGGTGISVDGDADVTGHVLIQNCVVHDCGWNTDDISPVKWTAGIKVWGGANYGSAGESDDVVIENCEVYNQIDTHNDYSGGGIWIDQWGTGAIARNNRIHNNATYGILIENMNDGAIVNNNLIYQNRWGIAVYRDIKNQKIYNNTLFGNSDIGLWCKGGESAGYDHMINNEFKNNIVVGSLHALSAIRGGDNTGNGSGNVYEYNCLGPAAANFVEWGSGVYTSTYAAWESAYGRTTHSVQADPLFVSTTVPFDFHLQSNSPCIAKGTPVNVTTDFAGNPVPSQAGKLPDLGAYESVAQVQTTIPTVVTSASSAVTSSTATCGGTVSSDGGATVTDRGVCWALTVNPTISGPCTHDGSGTGSFTSNLTGLAAGTTYHVRAYATNSAGTGYGSDVTFATTPQTTMPSVATSPVTTIASASAVCGGSVSSDGGATVTDRGVCWALTANPTISGSRTHDGSGTGSFTSNLTGLAASTTHHVRAYATNSSGTAYGGDVAFTTLQQISMPSVTTSAVTSITTWSAVGGGNVSSDGGATITDRGVCWALTANPTISGSCTHDGVGTGGFTSNLTGLTAGTTYHVRAYATNSSGTAYGGDVPFTTSPQLFRPNVTTLSVTSITSTSAVSGGNVASDGGATVTQRGVCWGLTANPEVSGSHTSDGTGTGSFASSLTGLTAGTMYHVRAYATNSAGTSYGGDITFTTTSQLAPPTVTTSAVTSITSANAVSGGNVAKDGGAAVTDRGVCWGLTANPTIADSRTFDGSGKGAFKSTLTGLSSGTTYHVRAFAINSMGTSYGADLVFTTRDR